MQRIVLDDQNLHETTPVADGALAGRVTLTKVPPDALAGLITKRAEISRARVRMFSIPPPDGLRAFPSPRPSSMISMITVLSIALS